LFLPIFAKTLLRQHEVRSDMLLTVDSVIRDIIKIVYYNEELSDKKYFFWPSFLQEAEEYRKRHQN